GPHRSFRFAIGAGGDSLTCCSCVARVARGGGGWTAGDGPTNKADAATDGCRKGRRPDRAGRSAAVCRRRTSSRPGVRGPHLAFRHGNGKVISWRRRGKEEETALLLLFFPRWFSVLVSASLAVVRRQRRRGA